MLSKKMAFSLMSLITIFVLAFIASPALAANEITLSLKDGDNAAADDQGDYSAADGIQVKASTAITIKLASTEALGQITIAGENPDITITNTGATALAISALTRVNTKEYTFVIADGLANGESVTLFIPENKLTSVETGMKDHDSAFLTLQYLTEDPTGTPAAHVKRSDETTPLIVEDTVVFTVTLSEEPKGGTNKFTTDSITVTEATVAAVDFIGKRNGKDADDANVADATTADVATALLLTGPDIMLYEYSVTVKPKFETTKPIKFTIKRFEDNFGNLSAEPAVKEKEFKVAPSAVTGKPAGAGNAVAIPNDLMIPAGGYLIVAKDDGDGSNDEEKVSDSYIAYPGKPKDAATVIANRKPAFRTYNVIGVDLPNLSPTLRNGATIDLIGDKGLFITEIMWAMDGDNAKRQWIEIKNTTAAPIKTKDEKLMFYNVNEPLPAMTTVQDRVGTVTAFGTWYPKGQDGRTTVAANLPAVSLISMQRGMMADGMYADGTMETSWAASSGAPLNFKTDGKGLLIGTPGAMPATFMTPPTPPTEPTPPPTIPAAMADDIKITEVMVDTDNGRLPQWIELTSMATGEVSLDGWEMTIDNAIDEKVLGKGNAITVDLDGVVLDVSAHTGNTGKGQSVLVVAWSTGRHSENIRAARVIDLAAQLKQKRQYQLLSYDGFRITLVPPRTGATIASFGDIAGNLHEDWEIPMDEGDGRSSLIRSEMVQGVATHGTDVNGWLLASDTDLIRGQHSYYGSDEDAGTPGHDSGGPLPVELSHFRPARDKATGAAVITWATQSELNNAGFFIKRSQQRNGQFQVINATMVPGAGTTSEKQFYTYTDTTAQPNVVYYYQIEDVSLDGQRQTLTNGIRLKGHIGAAGKATTLWGELKSSNE